MTSPNDLAARADPFLRRIESLRTDRETERGESMARCRVIADDIKEVYGEAKSKGIEVKALKALVKRRTLEGQIAALPAEFDIDEQAQYQALAEAFGDTPFGRHMAAKATGQPEPDPWEQDERPDEEHLAKVGRGRGRPRKDAVNAMEGSEAH